MNQRHSCLSSFLLFFTFFLIGLIAVAILVPLFARQSFGASSPALNPWQRFNYALDMLMNKDALTQPRDPAGAEQLFVIGSGESVLSVSNRLEETGLIRSAHIFRTYLLWTGLDVVLQPGTYRLSSGMPASDIAHTVVSASLTEVTFTVLPGWRMEEIAASLPTSGLEFTPEAFLAAASAPVNAPDFLPVGVSSEGFLSPGQYVLSRTTSAEQLVSTLLQGFASELTDDIKNGFADHGLTVYQAVTLASIVQREAVVADEMPMIASVFYNRLTVDMPLQTDPTVQYAIGYNVAQATWWTHPLSGEDLQFDSPYNTYLYPGLPPGPISNPELLALQAVAFPEQSDYYFFQARCDGSGLHNFAETFEQHQQNNCP